MSKKIYIGMPILGDPKLECLTNLYRAINNIGSPDIQVSVNYSQGDSLIHRTRNNHMAIFLNDFKEFDYFMFLDSDLEIQNCLPNNNIFRKLIEHDKDFVGGLYALKNPMLRRSSSIQMDPNANLKYNSGLLEMRYMSTGCWLLKRDAIERMVDHYPELEYDADEPFQGRKVHNLFGPFVKTLTKEDGAYFDTRKLLSEDWAFCQRWKDMGDGNKIYADTSIALIHHGTMGYRLFDVEARKGE